MWRRYDPCRLSPEIAESEGDMTGDWFVYALISLNLGACAFYAWEGVYVKAFYWLCVVGLNWALLRMK